jgi:hypothetical protein
MSGERAFAGGGQYLTLGIRSRLVDSGGLAIPPIAAKTGLEFSRLPAL